jgi:hypothetical protein
VSWFTGVLGALGSQHSGRKWQCPGHALAGEHSLALVVTASDDGRLLLFCHAGCGWRDIFRALRLPPSALTSPPPVEPARYATVYLRGVTFPPPRYVGSPAERGFRFEAEHPYGDPTPVAWKVRLRHPSGAKEITWESLNPKLERVPGLLGRRQADLPMYRISDVRIAVAAGETVLLVESESSVDTLVKAGWYATTWAGGAADPPLEQIRDLLGEHREVVLIPDHDDAGLACAAKLAPVVPRRLLGEPSEDARDLLARLGPDGFRKAVIRT